MSSNIFIFSIPNFRLSQNEVSLEELRTQYSEDEDKQLTVSDTADLQNL